MTLIFLIFSLILTTSCETFEELAGLDKANIKLIGISCQKGSSLDKMSDMFIHTDIEKEACHNNLAPTTSSTCHLAVGDAIAMAIQKLKGFSPNEFGKYHYHTFSVFSCSFSE